MGDEVPQTEDLETLERERIELLKRLEAEEEGEIADDDEEEDETELVESQKGQSEVEERRSSISAATELARGVSPIAIAEPVSDGELDDFEEPDSRLSEPEDTNGSYVHVFTERRKMTPDPDEVQVLTPQPQPKTSTTSTDQIDSPPSPVQMQTHNSRNDYDWDDNDYDFSTKPHQTGGTGNTRNYNYTNASQDEDDNWEDWNDPKPPPPTRPKLHDDPSTMNPPQRGPGGLPGRQQQPPYTQTQQPRLLPHSGDRQRRRSSSYSDQDSVDSWSNQQRPTASTFQANRQPQQPPAPTASTPTTQLTGRELWAQRAKELNELNPIGDWVPRKKNKNKGKSNNKNQPPPLLNKSNNQFQKNWTPNQQQYPRPPAPHQHPHPGHQPQPLMMESNWGASASTSAWDNNRVPVPIADDDENWDEPAKPTTSTASAAALQPPPLPPSPMIQTANIPHPPLPPTAPVPAASAIPITITPNPESSYGGSTASIITNTSISYSVYAQLIASLLHWYGYNSKEIELLLNAPNLFRVRYEQLTAHLSKNETDLEQCFKVIGNDHDAYYREGQEQRGLIEWRRNVSGDFWGAPQQVGRGPLPPQPPANLANSLKGILALKPQPAAGNESRLYYSRPPQESQQVQLELLGLETRTAQDQFNPVNSTIPYQVFLEFGSFGDGISHEITRFRYIEYVVQVNSKDLLASVVSAYGLGVGGWPGKVKDWLEMRYGGFKRVPPQQQQQNGPAGHPLPQAIPSHAQNYPTTANVPAPIRPLMAIPLTTTYTHAQGMQMQQQPPLPLLSPPAHNSHRPPPPPALPSTSTPQPPLPSPTSTSTSRLPMGGNTTNMNVNVDYDHFQRLYTRNNPALYGPAALNGAYADFCRFATTKYTEYIQALCSWFPGIPVDEVEKLVAEKPLLPKNSNSQGPVARISLGVAPPPPSLNGNGNKSSHSHTKSNKEKDKDKSILVTSKTAFRAAYKRRTEIKRE